MFTIRVELNGDRSQRDVSQCERYHVKMRDGNRSAEVTLYGESGDPKSIQLENGASMYVMNEAGTTVDIIRTRQAQTVGDAVAASASKGD